MDKVGLNYDFDNLTPEVFREFLRELQKSPYRWPNLYFAWEKPDGSLLMVGTNSSQMYDVLVRECNPDDWINKNHIKYGEALEYSSVLYGISPNTSYMKDNVRYDPVERLVAKVADYKYLGHWRDLDVLMDDPYGYNRVLACGRWELAKEKIGISEKSLVLEYHGDVDLPFGFIDGLGDKALNLAEAGKDLLVAQLEKISGVSDICVEMFGEYRNGYGYSFSFVVERDAKVVDKELANLFGGLKYEAYYDVAKEPLEDKLHDAEVRSADKKQDVSGKERDGSIEMV